jgi:TetR/AcrR family transcriptional regulator
VSAVPEKTPRRQQQRSIRTKQKLLDAALEAFSENGFKGTSTRDIAERAGVHHPLITYHFKNKDELWRASAKYIFRDFISGLSEAQEKHANDCPKARFAAMIRIYVHYAASHPALHKIILQESSYPSKRLDWLIEKFLQPLSEVAIGYVAELQEKGVAPEGNPALIYNMIRVSSGGLIALALELKGSTGVDLTTTENLDQLADLIIRVFLPGDLVET